MNTLRIKKKKKNSLWKCLVFYYIQRKSRVKIDYYSFITNTTLNTQKKCETWSELNEFDLKSKHFCNYNFLKSFSDKIAIKIEHNWWV